MPTRMIWDDYHDDDDGGGGDDGDGDDGGGGGDDGDDDNGRWLSVAFVFTMVELVAHTVKSQIELSCLFSVTPRVQKRDAPNGSKSN